MHKYILLLFLSTTASAYSANVIVTTPDHEEKKYSFESSQKESDLKVGLDRTLCTVKLNQKPDIMIVECLYFVKGLKSSFKKSMFLKIYGSAICNNDSGHLRLEEKNDDSELTKSVLLSFGCASFDK